MSSGSGGGGSASMYPAAGLQFNPNNANSAQDVVHMEEAQEIMVGDTGNAILLGDETHLTSDDGDHRYTSQHAGLCPNWLKRSSPKTKKILGAFAMLIFIFIVILAVGATEQSSPSSGNNGSDPSGSIVMDENTATNPSTGPLAPPTPKPISVLSPGTTSSSSITTSFSPTPSILIIPISDSQVNIVLPSLLEDKVPDFTDGLSTTEELNWNLIEQNVKETIYNSLTDSLPSEYDVSSIQVNEFDGYLTDSIRRKKKKRRRIMKMKEETGIRHLQQTIYNVVYSTSIKVDCSISDCSSATATISSATSDLAQLDYIESPPLEIPDTNAPVAVPTTGTPTISPVKSTPNPTAEPTNKVTSAPVTNSPTDQKYLGNRDCTIYTPCESCLGECSDDGECDEGLRCFQRMGYDLIPGCLGAGRPGQSYCYNPFANGLTAEDLLLEEDIDCDKKDTCNKCEGDCDLDEDCEKGLFCYRRSAFELVPGCAGQGVTGRDYCFDPNDLVGDF